MINNNYRFHQTVLFGGRILCSEGINTKTVLHVSGYPDNRRTSFSTWVILSSEYSYPVADFAISYMRGHTDWSKMRILWALKNPNTKRMIKLSLNSNFDGLYLLSNFDIVFTQDGPSFIWKKSRELQCLDWLWAWRFRETLV